MSQIILRKSLSVSVVIASCMLWGCGQKGPLKLPPKDTPASITPAQPEAQPV